MQPWIFVFLYLLAGVPAHALFKASDFREGFVEIAPGERLWVSYKPPAPGGRTAVLLNALTYTTKPWQLYAEELANLKPELGILRYDMTGMGESLLDGRLPVNYRIPYTLQVRQLRDLLRTLKIEKPSLVGLSYGGGIALAYAGAFPASIDQLVLMAPFTESIEEHKRWLQSMVNAARLTFPLNPASDEEVYDFILRRAIYTNVPVAEPVTLANPFILESIYRLTQGIDPFRAESIVRQLPPRSLHLLVGKKDKLVKGPTLDRFWEAVPPEARASRLNIAHTGHKIPEEVPTFSAAWTIQALFNTELRDGRVFEGSPWTFRARADDCELFLLPGWKN